MKLAAPENTIASAEQAIARGADYIEFDIAISADREYFVIHDTTVDRTTDGAGTVAEMSAAKLDSLDAGSWFSADFAGEHVPRLGAFLQTVRGRAKLFVDIKAGVPEEFIGLIREAGMARDCFIWSEEPEMIEKVQRFDSDLQIMAR
ncbi:MAG: glycerophosphodiester phosphodiesterase family protein, partial [Chloroflexi bacterium]|nr:glycerophosphodiester phosphodiesterase family protein [Chloroflexota bacterium]